MLTIEYTITTNQTNFKFLFALHTKTPKTRLGGFWVLGPSDRTRTCSILLPNNSGNFFLTFSAPFWHLFFRKSCSLELSSPLSPCTPNPVMVKYVVKTASLKSRRLFTRSRERFCLCNCSLCGSDNQVISVRKNCTAINKE